MINYKKKSEWIKYGLCQHDSETDTMKEKKRWLGWEWNYDLDFTFEATFLYNKQYCTTYESKMNLTTFFVSIYS